MPSPTVENYLKQIYLERQQGQPELVPMGRLAAAMHVTPGTATAMIKALAEAGLVAYEPRTGVSLTRAGERLALHVLRRHRLVELFLVRVLGLDWSEVHDEAEELEHSVSDKVLERIDVLLGRPTADPHGDPIPTARGKVVRIDLGTLADAEVARPYRVARVLDQDPQFLHFVERQGLTPGTPVMVAEKDAAAEAVLVRLRGRPNITLGSGAACKILIEPGDAKDWD
jgi:DtxR family Mn-dependent transcriptional regulator